MPEKPALSPPRKWNSRKRRKWRKREASRLVGFALFNLNKGNAAAAEVLMRKAYVALTGSEWDS